MKKLFVLLFSIMMVLITSGCETTGVVYYGPVPPPVVWVEPAPFPFIFYATPPYHYRHYNDYYHRNPVVIQRPPVIINRAPPPRVSPPQRPPTIIRPQPPQRSPRR